jgi:hypothetical protein
MIRNHLLNSTRVRIMSDFSFFRILKSLVEKSLMVCGCCVNVKLGIIIQILDTLRCTKLITWLQRQYFKGLALGQVGKLCDALLIGSGIGGYLLQAAIAGTIGYKYFFKAVVIFGY